MSDAIARGFVDIEARVDTNALSRSLDSIQGSISKGVGSSLQGLASGFKSLGLIGVGAIGTILGQSVQLGLSFQKTSQQVNAGLSAILGTQKQATALIGTFNDKLSSGSKEAFKTFNTAAVDATATVHALANESPFQREVFLSATQQLVGFGVEAKNIVPILDAVQQAVAGVGGTSADIAGVADVFAQIQAQGKITGEEINRLGLKGINAASILAKAFHTTAGAIKQDSSSIKGTSDEIIGALAKGIQQQFGGATEALGNTLDKAQDKFRSARRALGLVLVEPLVGATGGGAATQALFDINSILKSLAGVLSPVTALITQFGTKLTDITGKAKTFFASIKVADVQKFIDGLKPLAPILLAVAASFGGITGELTKNIPILGQILPHINPVVGAFIGFAIALPPVRTALKELGSAIIGLVQTVFPSLSGGVDGLKNVVGSVLVGVIKTITLAVTGLTAILPGIITTLTPIFNEAVVIVKNLASAISDTVTNIQGAIKGISIGDVVGNIAGRFGAVGVIIKELIPIIEKVAAAFGTLNFGAAFSAAQPAIVAFADKIGILEPVLTVIAAGAAAAAAALLVYKVAALQAAVATGVETAGMVLTALATEGLTAALDTLAATTGVVISPVLLVAAAVAAVAAIFVVLYLKVQPVRDVIDSLKDKFLALLPTMDQVRAAFSIIVEVLKVVGAILLGVVSVAITAVIIAFKLIYPVILALVNLVKGVLVTAFNALLPLFGAVGQVVKALIPVFQAVVNVVDFFKDHIVLLLPVLLPIFLAIGAAVLIVVGVFKLLPVIINVLSAVINGILKVAIGTVTALFKILAFEINAVVTVFNVIITIISAVVGAFITVKDAIFGAFSVSKDLVSAFLSFGPVQAVIDGVLGVFNTLKDAIFGFGPARAIIDGIKDAFGAVADILGSVLDKVGKVKSFFGKFPGLSFLKDGDGDKKKIDEIHNKVQAITPKIISAADAAKLFNDAVKELNLPTDNLNKQLDAAKAALGTSLDNAQKQFTGVFAAAEKAKSANTAVIDAQKASSDATKRVNELQKERAKILRDTISPANEIAQAERNLTRARFSLADIDKQVIATQKELNDLRGQKTADKEAANDRDTERAKIALARARRSENELLTASNDLKNKGNEQSVTEVSLAGLTLDQARNKLAATRSTLAAQQAGKKAETDSATQGKTAIQIEEDKKLARLDVLDAEQKVKDSEASGIQFKIDTAAQIQADEQKLIDLGFQKSDQLLAINDQQNHLNDLRKGETALAGALLSVDNQIKDAKAAQAAAANRVREAIVSAKAAEIDLGIETAKITGNLTEQARLTALQVQNRANALGIEGAVRAKVDETTNGIQIQINKVNELNNALKGIQNNADVALQQLLTQAGVIGPNANGNQQLAVQLNDPKSLVNMLLKEGSPFRDAMIKIINERFTGFAHGGLVGDSATGSKYRDGTGQIVRVAEYGNPELIVPLTKPDRVWELLSKHLPKFPGAMQAARAAIGVAEGKAGPMISVSALSSPSPSPTINFPAHRQSSVDHAERRNDQREFAQMIAEELINAGFKGDINIEAPITVEGSKINEDILARRLEQRITKSIERGLR